MNKTLFALVFMAAFTGCSSSPTFVKPVTKPPAPAPTSLVVIGNSITQHGPTAALGWTGNWGMAASEADKDFLHITAAGLSVPYRIVNGAPAESDPVGQGPTAEASLAAAVTAKSFVVLELGENVGKNATAFRPVYDALATEAAKGQSFVCLSDFWANAAIDGMMQQVCAQHGGIWIPIGDIFTDPSNPDYQGAPEYDDAGVQRHPHDWSMAQIASRILKAEK